MAVRKFKPTTPGQRHKIIGTFEEITASVPEKSLVYGKKSSGGRNSEGKMTMRYIGGGHRKVIRIVDFKRNKDGVPAVVKTIEYDPNRSARIALLFYADGEKRYIIAPNGLQVGATLMSGETAAPEIITHQQKLNEQSNYYQKVGLPIFLVIILALLPDFYG